MFIPSQRNRIRGVNVRSSGRTHDCRSPNCCANRFLRRKALKMKTNWTKIYAVIAASTALSFAAFAQAPDNGAQKPAAATPTADQILDRYVTAIGGEAAWHKLNSRIAKGTIEIPAMSLSGTVESHEKAPSSMLVDVNLRGAPLFPGGGGPRSLGGG